MKSILNWFRLRKLWLRGGILGIVLCLGLGLIYLFLYFPIVGWTYDGMIPDWALTLVMMTGHGFPILSHFIIPYGLFCPLTELECVHWSAESSLGAVPWMMEGVSGYCLEQVMTPTELCADLSEVLGFFGLFIILLAVYFAIGTGAGLVLQKIKKK